MTIEILAAALVGLVVGWVAGSRGWREPRGAEPARGETVPMVRAFEHLSEGVMVIDEEGQVRAMNTAANRLLGWGLSAGDELPAPLKVVAGRELEDAVIHVGDGAALRPVEVKIGGEDRTYGVIVGPAGRSRRFVVIEDLSGIASVDRRRRDFVANASHELQTPIAALVGMLELLEDADGEYAENLLRRCQKKVEALSVLTRDLIGLAKAQDESWVPAARSLKVEPVCRAVAEEHAESAAVKGLEITVEATPDLVVIVDPVVLETCLANLVQNAVCYTDAGGVVLRARARDGGGAILEVEDTGAGIAPEVLPRIFERFFRGDPARSRASGGSGLGLAIVRNLIGRMGGRVAVSSHVGEGTCFQLELPADPAHPLEGAGQALQDA